MFQMLAHPLPHGLVAGVHRRVLSPEPYTSSKGATLSRVSWTEARGCCAVDSNIILKYNPKSRVFICKKTKEHEGQPEKQQQNECLECGCDILWSQGKSSSTLKESKSVAWIHLYLYAALKVDLINKTFHFACETCVCEVVCLKVCLPSPLHAWWRLKNVMSDNCHIVTPNSFSKTTCYVCRLLAPCSQPF